MKKLKLPKWFHRVMVAILAIPTVWLLVAYKHDERYLQEFNDIYYETNQRYVYEDPPIIGILAMDVYNFYVNMPRLILSDKVAQQYIFETYEVDEEKVPLTSAVLSLEDEMEYKWELLDELENDTLWLIPNDKRILTLSKVMLQKSFTEQEFWRGFASKANSHRELWSNSIVDEYQFYADEFGYLNFNSSEWWNGLSKMTWLYIGITAEQVVFALYLIALLVGSLRTTQNEIKGTNNDKDKR